MFAWRSHLAVPKGQVRQGGSRADRRAGPGPQLAGPPVVGVSRRVETGSGWAPAGGKPQDQNYTPLASAGREGEGRTVTVEVSQPL